IKVEQQWNETNSPQTWKTTITNASKEQRQLNLNWEVSWDGSSVLNDLHYWNGNKTPVSGQQLFAPMADNHLCSPIIQAIYNDQNGIALALDPIKITPVFKETLDRNISTFYLHLKIPLVLDAGKSETFPVEIYQFNPRYGYLDVLQKYFYAHPKTLTVHDDTDQKTSDLVVSDKSSYELTRRFGGDRDWASLPVECTRDTDKNSEDQLLLSHYAMGQKPILWPNTQETENDNPDTALMLLESYRYGGYPSLQMVEVVPAIADKLPLLKEVVSSGWQPVPATRAINGDLPDFIWSARYGREVGSFITLGNASSDNWSGQIIIDDDYLGANNYLFVNEDGTPLSQSMNGRTTVINVQIPARKTLVLRAVSEVSRFAQGGATVSWKDDGAKGQLTIESTFTPTKVIAPRTGWTQTSVSGNVWNFDSAYFESPVTDIQNFPFFGSTKNALIVLPTDPSPDETWATQHIQQYFQFWGKNGIKPAQDITLKIISGLAPRDADQPLIYVGEVLQKIHTKGIVLQVGKTDTVSLKDATIHLLDALDKKYFYSGNLPRGDEEKGNADAIK
ncbi:MAG: hypothetical protein ABI210_15500, partial [Abditibacteriaceae bacterium]